MSAPVLRLCSFVAASVPRTFPAAHTASSRVGLLLSDGSVLDPAAEAACPPALSAACADMQSLIAAGPEALQQLRDMARRPSPSAKLPASSVRLLAPVPRPRRNVLCVGKNYLDHVREIHVKNTSTGATDAAAAPAPVDTPKYAQFFTKAPECVVGPGDGVPSHANITRWLDYEVELAVVVGKQGVNISRADALDHVFGWSIANDVTARDVQKKHTQFFKGKTLDGTCPLGPCIVPRDDLNASDLSLKLWVNGDLRQNGRTSDMIFDVPAIIEQLSAGFTLYPGDVILTGTPSGVGYAMNPPQNLKAGDVMRLEIEGIGALENTVV